VRTVHVAGEPFAVLDEGRGPPVLLVHGFPFDHTMWSAQIEALAPRHRVIAPDLRGFGGSVVTSGTVGMERFADDLAGLLDALGVSEPTGYVGFSMGGYVAWPFVRAHRRRVSRLALCDTRAAPDAPEAARARSELAARVLAQGSSVAADAMLPRLLAPGRAEHDPALASRVRGIMLAADPRGVAAALAGMARRPDSRPLLRGLRLPALVVVGEHDAISTRDEMRTIADALPDARYVLVPGAGHLAPMEAPREVSAALLDFLRD